MGDILNLNWSYLDIPKYARGNSAADFIWFKWDNTIDPSQYSIYVEDVSSGIRTFGKLQPSIKIPNVFFPPNARLFVQNSSGTVQFDGRLKRGSTYNLSSPRRGMQPLLSTVNTSGTCSYNTAY